jgi:hypothetical protein
MDANHHNSIMSPQRGSLGGVGLPFGVQYRKRGNVDHAAPAHSCKYRWLRAPATKISSSRGQNGDNPETKRGRSASRRQAKRSAFVLPAHLQSSPEFLVGHVQVALCLLNARVAEHQLDDADVDAIREQSTRALVAQIVPAEIDPFELFSIPLRSLPSGPRFDAVRELIRVARRPTPGECHTNGAANQRGSADCGDRFSCSRKF